MTKRQPRGVPVGGQFAANAHDEAAPMPEHGESPVEESKRLHDFLDEQWVIANRVRAGERRSVPRTDADRVARDEAWARLHEMATDGVDDRGFEPHTFSTAKPVEFSDPGDDRFSTARGSRANLMISKPEEAVAEIERDIAEGVRAGSLSPLFDYSVEYHPRSDHMESPEVVVHATLKPGTEQYLYRDVARARVASIPRYSDRVRGTVTKIKNRLAAYQNRNFDDDLNEETFSSLRVRVTTSLTKLGD